MHTSSNWAVILAGGDGKRLQPFTREIHGDERPKQFCRLLARATLLGATRARLCQIVAPERTLFVLNGQHQKFYREDLAGVPMQQLIEQPANNGTGAAVIYSLARLKRFDPNPVVGFFPADHHFDDVALFRRAVAGAYAAAREDPTRIILLGATPQHAECDYGWVLRGSGQPRLSIAAGFPVFGVEGFVEKPSVAQAMSLMVQGGVWNTFVLVGQLRTFGSLLAAASPRLCLNFGPLLAAAGGSAEAVTAAAVYASTPPVDLSRDVLALQPERLAVLESPSMGWVDLGRAERVLAARAAIAPGAAIRQAGSKAS